MRRFEKPCPFLPAVYFTSYLIFDGNRPMASHGGKSVVFLIELSSLSSSFRSFLDLSVASSRRFVTNWWCLFACGRVIISAGVFVAERCQHVFEPRVRAFF